MTIAVYSQPRGTLVMPGGLTCLSEIIVTDSQLINAGELDKNHVINLLRFPLSDLSVAISGQYTKGECKVALTSMCINLCSYTTYT
jgi:hypothetical protein